jgi:hypothetical protein
MSIGNSRSVYFRINRLLWGQTGNHEGRYAWTDLELGCSFSGKPKTYLCAFGQYEGNSSGRDVARETKIPVIYYQWISDLDTLQFGACGRPYKQ